MAHMENKTNSLDALRTIVRFLKSVITRHVGYDGTVYPARWVRSCWDYAPDGPTGPCKSCGREIEGEDEARHGFCSRDCMKEASGYYCSE